MHREYHPDDLNHLRAHAFGAADDDHDHHDHDHHHHHDDRRSLYTLTAAMGVLIAGDVACQALGVRPLGVSLATVAALLGGARIVYGALEALWQGRIGADIALAQACVAALVIGEPFVAAEVVFIALCGEVLEAVTFDRAQRAIGRLIDQTPRTARVRRDGREIEVPAAQVRVGDVVIVRPGERVPVDGPVVAGRSAVDQSPLTGESTPVDKGPGEPAFTGTINGFGLLEIRAERVGHDTTFGQVLRLVAEAQHRKSPLERTADRYARYFLPVVEAVAGLTLLAGYLLGWPDLWERTVAVLVVACPCALVLATPAAVMASLAWLARHGILIKGGAALERLATCDTVAFDKTGTLTLGRPEVEALIPLGGRSEDELLRLAATAEQSSRHPLATAVTRAAEARGLTPSPVTDAVALPGSGVSVRCEEREGEPSRLLLVGNRRLLAEQGFEPGPEVDAALADLDAQGQTPLIVALDGRAVGVLGLRDPVRPEAHDVVHDLKHLGITEVVLLTGDRPDAAAAIAKRVHIKTVHAELLPEDKARWIVGRQQGGRRVAMVGDGINDAPALAGADVGIALAGADLAAEAGDILVLGEPLAALPDLLRLSRATVRVIRQNILVFAFGLNATAMSLATLGVLGPVAAAILHQCGSLLVLLNAMRLLSFGDWPNARPVRWLRRVGHAIRRADDRLDLGPILDAIARRWRLVPALALLLGIGTYATWNWVAIPPGEVGLLVRLGRSAGSLGPGLHLRLPPPFEAIRRLAPARVRALDVGFVAIEDDGADAPVTWESTHDRAADDATEESLLLTGDGRLAELAATVQYRLAGGPAAWQQYAFRVAEPDAALRPLAEAAIREVVARRALDDLLSARRAEAEAAAADLLRDRVDRSGLGLRVLGVAFRDVHPPLEVVDAYRDVSRAESETQARINRARTYRAERLAAAQGQAAATVHRAEADSRGRRDRAAGESDAFGYRQQARAASPALSDLRLYAETMEAALRDRPKVILDEAHADRRRHLILPGVPLLSTEVGRGITNPSEK